MEKRVVGNNERFTVAELRKAIFSIPGDVEVKILNPGGIIARAVEVWYNEGDHKLYVVGK